MNAPVLVESVFAREHARLRYWALPYVSEGLADVLASQCIADVWYAACQGMTTTHGPYRYLYEVAEPRLRNLAAQCGRTVPVGVRRTIPLPSQLELNETVQAYCTVALAAEQAQLSWDNRALVAQVIRRSRSYVAQPNTLLARLRQPSRSTAVLAALAALLITKVPPTDRMAAIVATLWTGELNRSNQWRVIHADLISQVRAHHG